MIDFSKYDFLILTSKQTSEALKQYDQKEYLSLPSICVSKKSAEAYEALGGSVLAYAKGHGDELSSLIKQFSHTKKWLYLRAKAVASDFVNECQREGFCIDEKVVYESSCSQEILQAKIQENAILIFTSPSSVRCFLKNHQLYETNTLIVIGKTTAQALPHEVKYILSEDKTIQSCIDIAINL